MINKEIFVFKYRLFNFDRKAANCNIQCFRTYLIYYDYIFVLFNYYNAARNKFADAF